MKYYISIIIFVFSFSANAQQWVLDEIADEQNSSDSLPGWLIVLAIIIGYFIYKYLQKKDDKESEKRAKEYREEERQRLYEELEERSKEREIEELDRDEDFSYLDDDLISDNSDYNQNDNLLEEYLDDNNEAYGNFLEEPEFTEEIDFAKARKTATCKDESINTPSQTTVSAQQQDAINVVCYEIEPIDLGLSVKWANYNLGASPTNIGGKFFIWGEVIEHETHESSIRLEKVGKCAWRQKNNYVYTLDGKDETELKQLLNGKTSICGNPNYDVASKILGDGWRLPSKKEAEELQRLCKWSLITKDGIKGTKVTGPNGNSIFIPFAGYIAMDPKKPVGIGSFGNYWLGDPTTGNKGYAAAFALQQDTSPYFPVSNPIVDLRRCNAHSIRAVFDDKKQRI